MGQYGGFSMKKQTSRESDVEHRKQGGLRHVRCTWNCRCLLSLRWLDERRSVSTTVLESVPKLSSSQCEQLSKCFAVGWLNNAEVVSPAADFVFASQSQKSQKKQKLNRREKTVSFVEEGMFNPIRFAARNGILPLPSTWYLLTLRLVSPNPENKSWRV